MVFREPHLPAPSHLSGDGFSLRPITVDDTAADFAAVMETREELRRWEGSDWPADDFTEAGNRDDLTKMQERHEAGRAFSYIVLGPDGTTSLGCVYLFAPDAGFLVRSGIERLGTRRWEDLDAVAYFWVRRGQREQGLEERLLGALRAWLRGKWNLSRVAWVVADTYGEQQVTVRAAGLVPGFTLMEPDKPGGFSGFVEAD
jgi:hypothetical protein